MINYRICNDTEMLKLAKQLLVIVILALIISFIFKSFILNYYVVPSESMEPNLLPGEGILVSKLNYGPRFDWNLFTFSTGPLTEHRLPGFSKIYRGDPVVFNSPENISVNLVKRCVGMPGDTLEIRNSQLLVNNKLVEYTTFSDFELFTKDSKDIKKKLDSLTINFSERSSDSGTVFSFSAQSYVIQKLKRKNPSFFIRKANNEMDKQSNIFPVVMREQWTSNNYGRIIIPQKGIKIRLTTANILRYLSIFLLEKKIKIKNGKAYCNNREMDFYTFSSDYYFMLGDNRDHSYDSRWIGFIPYNLIIGKAVCVIYSTDPVSKNLRYSRMFKSINR